jgi:hypothetical protein
MGVPERDAGAGALGGTDHRCALGDAIHRVGSAKRSTVWADEGGRPVAGFLNSLHDDFTDCDDYC